MYEEHLGELYKDFFGEEEGKAKLEALEKEENLELVEEDIDKLLIEDKSKELLHKVVDYMKKYDSKEESKFLNFHLLIQSDNKETINKIEEIIKGAISKYKYLENAKTSEVSFYDLSDIDATKNIFIKDIKGIDLKDNEFQEKFFHMLEENLTNKNLIILEGNKEEIDYFFEFNSSLRDKYFPFILEGINPDIQDIYNEVLSIVNENNKFDDEFTVKILDYITETYPKTEYDYPTYRDTLCIELVFNKEIPKIESEKSIVELFAEFNELVGLEKVKNTLHDLVDYMQLRKKSDELKLNSVNLHMVFLGNPGTGKTTVARIIVGILYNLGYIKQNKLIEVSSKDLVAEYVGQTAPKTMAVVERALLS